jgi:hypothetical protein
MDRSLRSAGETLAAKYTVQHLVVGRVHRPALPCDSRPATACRGVNWRLGPAGLDHVEFFIINLDIGTFIGKPTYPIWMLLVWRALRTGQDGLSRVTSGVQASHSDNRRDRAVGSLPCDLIA